MEVASVVYDGRHRIGEPLASRLVGLATSSIGQHQSSVYAMAVQMLCAQLDLLRTQIAQLDAELRAHVERSELAQHLVTINGLGIVAVARLLGEVGDPARFRNGAALAAYVGVSPRTNWSGKRRPTRSPLGHLGHANLRSKLWMPTLSAA